MSLPSGSKLGGAVRSPKSSGPVRSSEPSGSDFVQADNIITAARRLLASVATSRVTGVNTPDLSSPNSRVETAAIRPRVRVAPEEAVKTKKGGTRERLKEQKGGTQERLKEKKGGAQERLKERKKGGAQESLKDDSDLVPDSEPKRGPISDSDNSTHDSERNQACKDILFPKAIEVESETKIGRPAAARRPRLPWLRNAAQTLNDFSWSYVSGTLMLLFPALPTTSSGWCFRCMGRP